MADANSCNAGLDNHALSGRKKKVVYLARPRAVDFTARLLRDVGFVPIVTYEIDETIQKTISEQPDFVVLFNSPEEECENIRRLRAVYKGTIVALTYGSAEMAIEAGCNFHYALPADPDDFVLFLNKLHGKT